MKHLSALFIALFMCVLGLYLPQTAFAAIEFNYTPRPVYAKQRTTLIAKGCNIGTMVRFSWVIHGRFLAVGTHLSDAPVDDKGEAFYVGATGWDSGTWTIEVECTDTGEKIQDTMEVLVNENTITVTTDPSPPYAQHSSKILVGGCIPNSSVEIFWSHTPDLNSWFGKTTQTADGKGELSYTNENGWPAGSYYMIVRCGGGEKVEPFTVIQQRDANGRPIFPTDPPPPAPPCMEGGFVKGQCTKINTAVGELCTEVGCFVQAIFVVLLSLTGGVAVLIFIYAGYLYMISRGNAEQIQRAREMIVSAIVGILFIVFSFVIMEVITGDILKLPGFEQYGKPCDPVGGADACD